MYMLKLNHLVDDKMHARSPVPTAWSAAAAGRQGAFGGSALGKWSLGAEAYGAALHAAGDADGESTTTIGRTQITRALSMEVTR